MSATQTFDQPRTFAASDLPRLLTTQEAARVLRSDDSTIRRLARDGKLPAVKIGGRVLIFSAELEHLLTPPSRD